MAKANFIIILNGLIFLFFFILLTLLFNFYIIIIPEDIGQKACLLFLKIDFYGQFPIFTAHVYNLTTNHSHYYCYFLSINHWIEALEHTVLYGCTNNRRKLKEPSSGPGGTELKQQGVMQWTIELKSNNCFDGFVVKMYKLGNNDNINFTTV